MSMQNERDPRAVLVRDKYFTLRPKPLERWLWQQGLPQAAERVFWLHWEEGMRNGDWCSELSLRQVARECCIDLSTVTRAYQVLKSLELIRREDPGRNPDNPFQQSIAITEVRVPRDLLVTLAHTPNRAPRAGADAKAPAAPIVPLRDIIHPQEEIAAQRAPGAVAPSRPRLSRDESAALMRKLSKAERAAFFVASRDRRTSMAFDDSTVLTPEERGRVLELLSTISAEMPKAAEPPKRATVPTVAKEFAKPRQLSPLEAARLRRQIGELVPVSAGPEVFRQVLWSAEEGALRRFPSAMALNIALKKIREGAWSKPNRMPPNWMPHVARVDRAVPEQCSAA
jgi:hypothetical protein